MKKLLLSGIIISLCVTSCTIERRVHRPGYAIEWNLKKHEPRAASPRKASSSQKAQIVSYDQEAAFSRTSDMMQEEVIASSGDLIYAAPVKSRPMLGKTHTPVKPAVVLAQKRKVKDNLRSVHNDPVRNDKAIKGVMVMLVGLLFLGLGLILVSVLGLFGVIFLLIFSIAAVISLLAGLVMLVYALINPGQ